MKKSYLLLALGLGVATLGLSGCSNHTADVRTGTGVYQTYVYSNTDDNGPVFNKFSYGMRYVDIEMRVVSGEVTDVSFSETLSPMAWARLGTKEDFDAKYSALGDDVIILEDMYVDATTKADVYFAKHIKIGDYIFEGSVRTDVLGGNDTASYRYATYGELIKWADATGNVTSLTSDLNSYLDLQDNDSDYDLGKNALWYIDAVENDQVAIVYPDGDGYTEVDPNYPEGKKHYEELSGKETFNQGLEQLYGLIVGGPFTFVETVQIGVDNYRTFDETVDSSAPLSWAYNGNLSASNYGPNSYTILENVLYDDFEYDELVDCFEAANIAFASVEFQTLV